MFGDEQPEEIFQVCQPCINIVASVLRETWPSAIVVQVEEMLLLLRPGYSRLGCCNSRMYQIFPAKVQYSPNMSSEYCLNSFKAFLFHSGWACLNPYASPSLSLKSNLHAGEGLADPNVILNSTYPSMTAWLVWFWYDVKKKYRAPNRLYMKLANVRVYLYTSWSAILQNSVIGLSPAVKEPQKHTFFEAPEVLRCCSTPQPVSGTFAVRRLGGH